MFRLNEGGFVDALACIKNSGSHWHTEVDKFVSLTGCEAMTYLTE